MYVAARTAQYRPSGDEAIQEGTTVPLGCAVDERTERGSAVAATAAVTNNKAEIKRIFFDRNGVTSAIIYLSLNSICLPTTDSRESPLL